MTIKLDAHSHNLTNTDLWLEYSNIREVTLTAGDATIVTALCDWRIHDKDGKSVFSPEISNCYTKASLTAAAYASWDKTEEQFGTLLLEYLAPIHIVVKA